MSLCWTSTCESSQDIGRQVYQADSISNSEVLAIEAWGHESVPPTAVQLIANRTQSSRCKGPVGKQGVYLACSFFGPDHHKPLLRLVDTLGKLPRAAAPEGYEHECTICWGQT